MKKQILFTFLSVTMFGLSLNANTMNNKLFTNKKTELKEVLTMKPYDVYCNGVWKKRIYASSQEIADSIAYNVCNG